MRPWGPWFAGLITALALRADATPPYFVGLDQAPGSVESWPSDISADGTIVLGGDATPGGTTHFLWTHALGRTPVPLVTNQWPEALSGDGTTVVGVDFTKAQAFRWSGVLGMEWLGSLTGEFGESWARAVSHDGQTVVGDASGVGIPTDAFRWTPAGMTGLAGGAVSEDLHVSATDTSADGTVIVGRLGTLEDLLAYRWTLGGPVEPLGRPAGTSRFTPSAISGDGHTIIGEADLSGGLGTVAVRWTRFRGFELLGDLPGSPVSSGAWGVDATGQVVVGIANLEPPFGDAFIWDRVHGMRDLEEHLVNDLGLDLDGWELRAGTGMSADGRTIVGQGIDPDGNFGIWVAYLPEPDFAARVGAGVVLVGLLGRRRPHGRASRATLHT